MRPRRKRVYIDQIRISLSCSIYNRTVGLYRQYNELSNLLCSRKSFRTLAQRKEIRSPSAQYSNPSSALPSDGFRPYVRTNICLFLLLIDNDWQMKLVITDKQRWERYKGNLSLYGVIAGDFQQNIGKELL